MWLNTLSPLNVLLRARFRCGGEARSFIMNNFTLCVCTVYTSHLFQQFKPLTMIHSLAEAQSMMSSLKHWDVISGDFDHTISLLYQYLHPLILLLIDFFLPLSHCAAACDTLTLLVYRNQHTIRLDLCCRARDSTVLITAHHFHCNSGEQSTWLSEDTAHINWIFPGNYLCL